MSSFVTRTAGAASIELSYDSRPTTGARDRSIWPFSVAPRPCLSLAVGSLTLYAPVEMLHHMQVGRGTWSRRRIRRGLVSGVVAGVVLALFEYANFDWTWQRAVFVGTFFAVVVAAMQMPVRRRPRRGFGELSEADQVAVTSAFRRGRPITPELASALLAYCGTARKNAGRSRRYLWLPAGIGVIFVWAAVVLLGHAARAPISGSILILIGFVGIWRLWQEWRLPRRIGQAERLARASLDAQVG
jgi:hypothetical protein